MPVFDRGDFEPLSGEVRAGLTGQAGRTELRSRFRTAADRRAGVAVTGRMLGDPKPTRAGQAPDCEDSRKVERSDEAYRLMGKEPPSSDRYALLDLDEVRARAELLKPRRYRPFREAAE